MSRVIEFRGRDIDNGEWRYGHYMIVASPPQCVGKLPDKHMIVFTQFCDWGFNPNVQSEIDPKTRGQFTGLQDKNGKDIYEGDITSMVYSDDSGTRKPQIRAVEWSEHIDGDRYYSAGYNLADAFGPEDIEVIGNIHETPELLEATT